MVSLLNKDADCYSHCIVLKMLVL